MATARMTLTPAFDYAAHQRIIDEMRAKSLFFVAGLPKSGTTWVKASLNAHPDVCCEGEGHFIDSLAPKLQDALEKHNKRVQYKTRVALQNFAKFPGIDAYHFRFLMASSILLLMAGFEKARRVNVVGEKTPDNFLGLSALAELFPAAKFIFVVRDPRDCSVSAWFHNMRLNPKGALEKFPDFASFVPHVARMWVDAVLRWEKYVATGASACTIVRYEDLVARPDVELSRLFGFLGVGAAAATVADCIAEASFAKMTGGRAAGQEDRHSLLRQGLPGDWLNHFRQSDATMLEGIAGAAMARYGYFPALARESAVPPQPPVEFAATQSGVATPAA